MSPEAFGACALGSLLLKSPQASLIPVCLPLKMPVKALFSFGGLRLGFNFFLIS